MPDFPLIAAIVFGLTFAVVLATVAPRHVLPVMIAIGVLTSRPTAIGERYPLLGAIILLAAGLACLVVGTKDKERTPKAPILIFGAAWIWLVVHEVLVPGSEENLGTSTITVLLPVLAFYFIARDRNLLGQSVRVLAGIVAWAAVLTSVALIGGALIGYQTLHFGAVELGYIQRPSGVLVPGALTYGPTVGSEMPRFLGVGREPGMGALFIGWAFFALPADFKWRNLFRLALAVALLGTQSTAGIGLFGVCWALFHVFGGEKFRPFVAILAATAGAFVTWIAVFNPSFGLLSKLTAGISFSDRNRATLDGLDALGDQFFTASSEAPLSSINLVAAIAVSGAPWFILMVAFLLAPIVRGARRSPFVYSALFMLLTLLTSQPLAGSTALLVLTLMNFYLSRERGHRQPTVQDPPAQLVIPLIRRTARV